MMEIRHTVRSKTPVPQWNELSGAERDLLRTILECGDCIDFESFDDAERVVAENLRDAGWVQLSYRIANGMSNRISS